MEPIYIFIIFGSFFFPCASSFSSVARVEILSQRQCVDIVFSNQFGASRDLDKSWQAVWRDLMFFFQLVPVYFSRSGELYNVALLWSSRDVLWTVKLYPTFHPHVKRADNDYIYIFMVNLSVNVLLRLKTVRMTHATICIQSQSSLCLHLPLSYHMSSTIRGQSTDIQIISVSIPSVNTHSWLDQKLPACLAAPREPLGAS